MIDRQRRIVHLPIGLVLAVILIALLSPIGSLLASVKIADNNARRLQAQAAAAEARQAAQSQTLVCTLFGSILDAYEETPPGTPAGRNVMEAWRSLYNLARCQPRR